MFFSLFIMHVLAGATYTQENTVYTVYIHYIHTYVTTLSTRPEWEKVELGAAEQKTNSNQKFSSAKKTLPQNHELLTLLPIGVSNI